MKEKSILIIQAHSLRKKKRPIRLTLPKDETLEAPILILNRRWILSEPEANFFLEAVVDPSEQEDLVEPLNSIEKIAMANRIIDQIFPDPPCSA